MPLVRRQSAVIWEFLTELSPLQKTWRTTTIAIVEAEEQEWNQLSSFWLINSEMRRYHDWSWRCPRESKSCKEETIISFPFCILPLFYLLLQGNMPGRFYSKLTTSKFQIKLKNNYNFCQLLEINLILIKCSIILLHYVDIHTHF